MSDTEGPFYEGSSDPESKLHSLPEKTPCWVAQRKKERKEKQSDPGNVGPLLYI